MRWLALFLGIVLCWSSVAQAVIVDRIVAVVNKDVITLSELDQAAEPFYQRFLPKVKDPAERERLIKRIRRQVLDQLINNHLVDQEVKRLHITVSDQEIDQFIANVKKQQGLSDEEFRRFLASQGLTLKEYREKVAEQIKRLKLIQSQVRERIVITDQEIRKYYQEHYAKEAEKYELAAIIITGEDAAEKAQKAFEEIKAGKPFAEVAAKYSVLPDSGKGLGTFSLEELSPEVRAVVQKLKPGEVSLPVKVGANWEIFKLLAVKKSSAEELARLRPEIENRLYQEKVDQVFKKWLKDLRKRSYIRILL